jgi:hypothetical protein
VKSEKLLVVLLTSLFWLLTSPVGVAQQPKVNYKGLEIQATGVERAQNVPLLDCPPGSNTQRGNARAGEEFAVVTLAFKVTPAFKEAIVKKPVLTDASGKVYNTSVAIIDPGAQPEYQCSFPFRVPSGTKVASVQVDTATIDLATFEKK